MIRPRRAAACPWPPLGDPEGAGQVGLDDRGPVVLAHPQEQGVGGDPGVGDEHLDRPVRLLDLREAASTASGSVTSHRTSSTLGWLHRCGRDRDLVALGDERLGDRAADAAVAAGDQYRSARV